MDQFFAIVANLKQLGTPEYDLADNNCVTYAHNLFSPYIDQLPSGNQIIGPYGVGKTPAQLGQSICELSSTYGNKYKESNGTYSPSTSNCN